MSLTKLKQPVPTKTVQTAAGEQFPVRGLNPADVMAIYYRHSGLLGGAFERLVASYQTNGNSVEFADVQTMAMYLLQEAPVVLAEIIAIAAGGEDLDEEVPIALKLPFAVQADALEKIGALTFTSEMPVGKFWSLVVGMLPKATGLISQNR